MMTNSDFKNKFVAKIFLAVFATSLTCNINATATEIKTITTNTNERALGGTAITQDNFFWGHNPKYSSILLDENIIVEAATILDIKYPQNNDLNHDYTIIGIQSYVIDKLDFAIERNLISNIFVYLKEGGIGHNSTLVRYISKASNDVEFNLKIFGVNV
ncbi:uncharacterized protein ACRADG_010925 [Cochliomyia hominivorax]